MQAEILEEVDRVRVACICRWSLRRYGRMFNEMMWWLPWSAALLGWQWRLTPYRSWAVRQHGTGRGCPLRWCIGRSRHR